MSDERMRPERFAALLDAYGAEPRRWPEGERQAALEYLMASRGARRLRDDAAALDGLLDAVPPARPSAGLRERVLANAPARRGGHTRLVAGALAASLLLGFVAGATLQQPVIEGEGGDFLQLAQLDDSFQDF